MFVPSFVVMVAMLRPPFTGRGHAAHVQPSERANATPPFQRAHRSARARATRGEAQPGGGRAPLEPNGLARPPGQLFGKGPLGLREGRMALAAGVRRPLWTARARLHGAAFRAPELHERARRGGAEDDHPTRIEPGRRGCHRRLATADRGRARQRSGRARADGGAASWPSVGSERLASRDGSARERVPDEARAPQAHSHSSSPPGGGA
jgi:hypothetical protein